MPVQTGRFTIQDMDIIVNANVNGEERNITIGVATDVSVRITNNIQTAYTNASRNPQELVSTTRQISFTMNIDWIDNELINSLFPPDKEVMPYFTLVGVTRDVDPPKKITLIDCKISDGNLQNIGLTSYGRISVSGQALGLKVE